MKKILLLSFGLIINVCIVFGQKSPQTNPIDNFPQSQISPSPTVLELEYNQKNFLTDIESISSGNWNEPGVWNCGCVPTFGDDVHVMPGHVVVINQNINITSIFIDTTATVNTTTSGELLISLTGDWINNGAFVPNSSEVMFSGFDDQSITGVTTFGSLSIENDREVAILSPIFVNDMLAISDVTLNTNDQLTLSYSDGATAEIAPILSGTINGKITAESFVDLAIGSWFSTAGPVTSATLAEWDQELLTTGFIGSEYPDLGFNNISYFTENSGYVSVENITDEIIPGAGYFIYENAGSHTYDITGNAIIGDFDFPVTYTPEVDENDRGWNLLGNPYVATLNWNNAMGWDKNNMSDALYIWDANAQTYKVFLNGYAVNGGSPIIKPFDNFFILGEESPSLTINENAKQVGVYTPIAPENNYFKFHLTGTDISDEIIIVLDDDASTNFDSGKDAVREFNPSLTEIVTQTDDMRTVCINSMPNNMAGFSIPLIINSPTGGEMDLNIMNIPEGMLSCMALEHVETGDMYNLEETSSITFTIPATDAGEVFILHIGGSVEATKTDVLCNADVDGQISAQGSGAGPWDYFWYDENSNLITSELEQAGASTIENLGAGTYTVIIGNLDFCTALTQTVEILEPTVLLLTSDVTQPECNMIDSGSITSTGLGGASGYSYLWSTGATTVTIEDLPAGEYDVTVTDINGCLQSESFTIEEAVVIDTEFNVQGILPMSDGQNEVDFENTSENGVTYFWDFGDSSISNEENPSHTYDEPGQYVVSLTAYNGECSTNYNYVINIEESTVSIEELENNQEVYVINENGNYALKFNLETSQEVEISIHNLLGQQLTKSLNTVKNEKIQLDIPTGQRQVYFVAITNKKNQTKKIFKLIQ